MLLLSCLLLLLCLLLQLLLLLLLLGRARVCLLLPIGIPGPVVGGPRAAGAAAHP
jgi:hypothetical protein